MARPSRTLVDALRRTAGRLRDGAPYAWSRMGSCNCGHLAQSLTRLSAVDVQRRALQQAGDWTEQAQSYCAGSGVPIEDVFAAMLRAGLTREDVGHLERLSDPAVLARVDARHIPLRHTDRDDVVVYLEAWAAMLEAELPVRARPTAARELVPA